MRLGILARADKTGLGYQTRDYYRHLNPSKVLLVNIQKYNGNELYRGWYDSYIESDGFPSSALLEQFMSDLDIVLTAETPYNYDLYAIARRMGVKTVCAPNYEFFDYFSSPFYPVPDALFVPSMWHFDDLSRWAYKHGVVCKYMHHPVDTDVFTYIERTTSQPYHICGKFAANDRNGTYNYLNAYPAGTIAVQDRDTSSMICSRYRHARVFDNIDDNPQLYEIGDILVLPRRYGGNCLPMNEALARGCPVIMPNISPNNSFLPQEWLVTAMFDETFTPRTTVDLYSVDLQKLIDKVEWMQQQDITMLSRQARELAESISWRVQRDIWMQELEKICQS